MWLIILWGALSMIETCLMIPACNVTKPWKQVAVAAICAVFGPLFAIADLLDIFIAFCLSDNGGDFSD